MSAANKSAAGGVLQQIPDRVRGQENVRNAPSLPSTEQDATSSDMTREEMDAKLEAAEARTDTKFAELLGEVKAMRAELSGDMKSIGARLDHVERATSGVRLNIWLAAVAVLGLAIAAMAYGGQQFGLGADLQSIVQATVKATQLNPPGAPQQ
ncbi:hypothetical protein J2X65_004270 [Ancylobacter sp. 3268]|uniref:hypothetical protein n=1 Tax=Ancylobacter sp. 3268 TaxID=2817752 RepID=UPI002860ADE0|nr:hypothetical protein [Ancylobacter sp. 3268]MDR6954894.1 hypothetical protein [Ancylobacter sp. 3268]